MVKTVYIKTIDELMKIISEQDYRPELDRYRNHYLYRGMTDSSFLLETSLHRNCKNRQQELEAQILRNWVKYAVLEDPTVEKSVWRQMILGQHHGLPTRLLDWTHSALIAMQFAVTESDLDLMDDHDCMIWRIDMSEIHSTLPPEYKSQLDKFNSSIFSVDMLADVTKDPYKYDRDMGSTNMCIIEPPSIDPRIVNQYSFFSVIPMGITNVEEYLDRHTENSVKYIIDKSLRWRVRDILDHLNISERIVYPGLDGLSKWLGRHYFVKESTIQEKE